MSRRQAASGSVPDRRIFAHAGWFTACAMVGLSALLLRQIGTSSTRTDVRGVERAQRALSSAAATKPDDSDARLESAEPATASAALASARAPAADVAPAAVTSARREAAPESAHAWQTALKVIDAHGAPVSGACVEVWRETAATSPNAAPEERLTGRTGADGRYELNGPWRRLGAVAWSDSTTSEAASLDNYQREVVLRLQTAGALAGNVRDALTGKPIEHAEVSLWTHAREDVVLTSSDGSFVHPRLPLVGMRQQVRARASGYAAKIALVENDALDGTRTWQGDASVPHIHGMNATAWLEFELEPEALVRGSVRDAAQRPIAGAHVRAEGYASLMTGLATPDLADALTDANGEYVLHGLRPDVAHAVLVESSGAAAALYELPAGAVHVLDVELESAALLHGALLDPSSWPAEGVQIDLTRLDAPAAASGGAASANARQLGRRARVSTDAAGGFVFDGLGAHRYRLSAKRGRTTLFQRDIVPAHGEAIELPPITLEASTLTLHGTLEAQGGALEGCRVDVWRGRWLGTVHADAAGHFRIAGLDAEAAYELRWCDRDVPEHVLATAQAWAFETAHLVAPESDR